MLVTYRSSEAAARAVADRIAAGGGRALVVRADLGTRAACEALVAEARERLGGLDVWVNNAGADVLTTEAADWDWERKLDLLLAVDLKGTIACSYAAGAAMREQPAGGAIVNMSWDHVTSGMAGAEPRALQRRQGRRARRTARASPARSPRPCGSTSSAPAGSRPRSASTPTRASGARWPSRRRSGAGARPADVAAAAVYLASPAAAFVTGQAINVNGGVVM